jgi:hypothetical protein
LNVKAFQAGKRGICPYCGAKFLIPAQSTRKSSKDERTARRALAASAFPGANPVSQDVAPSISGQVSAQDSLPSAPISANAAAMPQATAHVSQHDGAAAGFASPAVLTQSMNTLTTFSVDDPSVALRQSSPSDPLVQAGDVVWYVRLPSGGQYGPANSKLMRQWLTEGRIGADTLVWHEGWRDWERADAVFTQLRTRDALALAIKGDGALQTTGYSPTRKIANRRNRTWVFWLVAAIVVLSAIAVVGLLYWVVFRGAPHSAANVSAPSTSVEVRGTLRGYDSL